MLDPETSTRNGRIATTAPTAASNHHRPVLGTPVGYGLKW
jgi:hypothetical protein